MTQFIRIRLDDRALVAGLQQSKRTLVREANRELRDSVRLITLPTAKNIFQRKSGQIASKMRAGAAGNRAFIENKHPAAGLLEFGGTRTDIIRPRAGGALRTPAGPRAVVKGPRTYHGKHRMAKAIELTSEELLDAQLDGIARAVATATGGKVIG